MAEKTNLIALFENGLTSRYLGDDDEIYDDEDGDDNKDGIKTHQSQLKQ